MIIFLIFVIFSRDDFYQTPKGVLLLNAARFSIIILPPPGVRYVDLNRFVFFHQIRGDLPDETKGGYRVALGRVHIERLSEYCRCSIIVETEIHKDLFILAADAYQAGRLCAKSRYIRPFVNPLRGLL